MFSSLAFLNVARSFPRCFADSAERSLSIKTDEKRELFISFFLFSQAQSRYPFLKQSVPRLVVDVEVVMPFLLFLSELRCSQRCSKKLKCQVFSFDVSRGTLYFPDRRQVRTVHPSLFANTPYCSLQNFPEYCRNGDFLA